MNKQAQGLWIIVAIIGGGLLAALFKWFFVGAILVAIFVQNEEALSKLVTVIDKRKKDNGR